VLPETLKRLINDLANLPGLGPRSAERLALFLLQQEDDYLARLSRQIAELKRGVSTCRRCFGFSSGGECDICSDSERDASLLCIVEDPLDIYPLERTESFSGLYFVLGGLVDPLKGKLLDTLRGEELRARLKEGEVREAVFAFDFSFEGEATATLIAEELGDLPVRFSRLARGLPTGGSLDFADNDTLAESLRFRRQFSPGGRSE